MTEAVVIAIQPTTACPHAHTVIDTDGILYFSGGDVCDTLTERLICLDCGEDITPHDETEIEIPY